jgi:hypothetical protein
VASDGDRLLGHPDCVKSFFASCPRAAVTHRRVVDFDHGSRAPTHMTLVTDIVSRPIWHEIAVWIDARISAISAAGRNERAPG